MELSLFIQALLQDGRIETDGQFKPVTEEDREIAGDMLEEFYQKDLLHLPDGMPAYNREAACWAATYLYNAIKLAVNRDAEEDQMKESLVPFSGTKDASAIYSADLTLRQLPAILQLAKGLAPADILVQYLQQTAADWPFSSTGTGIAATDENIIISHPALGLAYTDRILDTRDLLRMQSPGTAALVQAHTGEQLSKVLPPAALLKLTE